MVEGAVRFMYGYGYGFDRDLETLISYDCANSNSVPGAPVPGIGNACVPTGTEKPGYIYPQTFFSARSEYQYFRFGLGFTLMRDGYFTHELGDSWHGQDWVRRCASKASFRRAPLLRPPTPQPSRLRCASRRTTTSCTFRWGCRRPTPALPT